MKHYTILYLSTLCTMATLDMLWLGFIAHGFYESRIGTLIEFHIIPGILFYLVYTVGILIFVNHDNNTNWINIALYGALFGFFAYATYDLTNLATLKNWPLSVTIVDITWGIVTTAIASTTGWLIARSFSS